MNAAASQSEWWRDGVLYQIYPRSFADSNGDGIGDLDGITAHLDHIASLGVAGLWLSPVYRSPMADFGYDVADYRDIDPIFGDMAAFDRLLGEAHKRDLKVVMDFVPNHTSDQHEWFIESRSSRDNPKRDFYIWADPKPDGSPPNNWRATFGGGAWTLDDTTGQYYLHLFLAEQPDLNWRNPEVLAAMEDVLRFWLDKGVDGFRIDVVHMLIKDPSLADNPPENPFSHVEGHDEPHEIIRGWRRLTDSYDDRMMVGETASPSVDEIVRYYGNGTDELHLAFNFLVGLAGFNARFMSATLNRYLDALPAGAQPCLAFSNHDLPRHVRRFGREAAKAAAMTLLTLPCTPFLYAGEEIGMVGASPPPERVVDPGGRDACRTPFQWGPGANAGFSSSTATPWLPIAPDFDVINLESEEKDPDSILAFYRRMIAFRGGSDALRHGAFDEKRVEDKLWVYERSGDVTVIVAINMDADPKSVALSRQGGTIAVSATLAREGETVGESLELAGFEAAIVAFD